MKRRILEFLALGILMALPIMVSEYMYAATDLEVSNVSTGSKSINNATFAISRTVNVIITNNADINNTVRFDTNTGGNIASRNTGDGTVKSGDIGGSINISNEANMVNPPVIPVSSGSAKVSVKNEQTGSSSVNLAGFSENNDQKVNVLNNLDVDNVLIAAVNTGGNTANGNTGSGSVTSGNISYQVSFATFGNVVKTAFGKGGGGGPILATSSPEPMLFGGKGGGSGPPATLPRAGGSFDIIFAIILSAIGAVLIGELIDRKFTI